MPSNVSTGEQNFYLKKLFRSGLRSASLCCFGRGDFTSCGRLCENRVITVGTIQRTFYASNFDVQSCGYRDWTPDITDNQLDLLAVDQVRNQGYAGGFITDSIYAPGGILPPPPSHVEVDVGCHANQVSTSRWQTLQIDYHLSDAEFLKACASN